MARSAQNSNEFNFSKETFILPKCKVSLTYVKNYNF